MPHPPVLPVPSSSAVDATWTVDEVLLAHPESAAVFNAFGVDSCCGGAASLGEAALHAQLTPRALLDALDRAVRATDDVPLPPAAITPRPGTR